MSWNHCIALIAVNTVHKVKFCCRKEEVHVKNASFLTDINIWRDGEVVKFDRGEVRITIAVVVTAGTDSCLV